MTHNITERIRAIINEIVSDEESDHPNWDRIGALSNGAIDEIESAPDRLDIDDQWYKFLEDWKIRQVDPVYGKGQRQKISSSVISGAGDQ